MSDTIDRVRTAGDLRKKVNNWREAGLRVGFVPTMGALHEGHISLVREALAHSDRVVASVFVNPAQFGPNEDYAQYPRCEEEDCRKLAQTGAHLVFLPPVEEMYRPGAATTVRVAGSLTERLEGAFRPGHFEGVATVVTKLLLQCLPDIAVFGEKDYQQLAVIRRMTEDLCIPVEIIGAPIVRDAQGLALSSRNAYLTETGLASARQLNKILFRAVRDIESAPGNAPEICETACRAIREAGFDSVDYFELVDADSLKPVEKPGRRARLITTARIEGVRLLDNADVEPVKP